MIIPRFSLAFKTLDLFTSPGTDPASALAAFEAEFAAFVGARQAFFLLSARSAFSLILKALNLPSGSKVIVSALNHPSIPLMLLAHHLEPVFCDIELGTYSLNLDSLSETQRREARAVVVTHLYGIPARLESIQAARQQYRWAVIEDVAQSLGAGYQQQPLGSFGDAAIFSFALTKNFTTLGGGMITVNREDLAVSIASSLSGTGFAAPGTVTGKRIMALAMQCATVPGIFACSLWPLLQLGYLSGRDWLHPLFAEKFSPLDYRAATTFTRPAPIQAALGRLGLRRLPEANRRRRQLGQMLLRELQELPGLVLPAPAPESQPVFTSFVVLTESKVRLAAQLLHAGIDTSPGYLCNCARLAPLAPYATSLPLTDRFAAQQLHLPLYPALSEAAVRYIAATLRRLSP